ncbi:hypothetical protein [Olivibacter sitiensis]|uniref:hypothetical protein n=1 Tax=Olivibacter sitiensis TaxID=376470 RepID=UPI000487C487|nr:hypothetical protein [Olivibacter sitiensis]
MNWQKNLAQTLTDSGYSDIEIYAWTNISVTALSNMRNEKHKHLTCEQFLLLKLLLNKNHKELLEKIFGKRYFDNIKKIEYKPHLTQLGEILKKRYKFEVMPKKELVQASKIKSSRIDYVVETQDSAIHIDEMTTLELAFGEEVGTLCDIRFKNLELNSKNTYERLLTEKRVENAKSNERRKPK